MSDILEFENVTFAYAGRPPSLNDVSFKIERGKKLAIVGPNGAGKTTLLLMCNGTLQPDSGEVRVNGEHIHYDKAGLRKVRSKVGLVFQNSDSQIFAPSVYTDVAFGPANLHLDAAEIESRVHDAIFAVGLSGYEKRPPHHLSGGEKKRVAIAGILAMKPDILVADEPTASLDPATAAEIMDLLDELHEDGTTIILSTHDVELAYAWADEVLLLAGGKLLHHGTTEEVFTDDDLMLKARLTAPALLNLYTELVKHEILPDNRPPKGVPEMMQLIEGSFEGNIGTIYTADTDKYDEESLRALVAEKNCNKGAMGTRSKKLCFTAGISLDYTYGVIDKAMLAALLGQDTLILTCGGMLDRVAYRVKMFEEAGGTAIKVVRI